MFKISIEDITSDVEVIIFPNAAKNISDTDLNQGDVILINGTLTRDGDEENSIPKIYFNTYEKLDTHLFSTGKALVYSIDNKLSNKTLEKIYDIIESKKGDRPILFEMVSGHHKYIYKFNIEASPKVEESIKNLLELEFWCLDNIQI